MNTIRLISYVLVIIGALNWGLIGIFGLDLVAAIFGDMSLLSRVIYTLVGISAFISLLTQFREE